MALWRPTRGGCSGLLLLAVVTLHVHAAGLPMSEHQKIAHSSCVGTRRVTLKARFLIRRVAGQDCSHPAP